MVLTVLKGLGKAYLKSQKSAIKKVAPTLGLKKTEAYKKSIEKALNEAKIGRSQERIDAWWKKNKKKFE